MHQSKIISRLYQFQNCRKLQSCQHRNWTSFGCCKQPERVHRRNLGGKQLISERRQHRSTNEVINEDSEGESRLIATLLEHLDPHTQSPLPRQGQYPGLYCAINAACGSTLQAKLQPSAGSGIRSNKVCSTSLSGALQVLVVCSLCHDHNEGKSEPMSTEMAKEEKGTQAQTRLRLVFPKTIIQRESYKRGV